MTEKRDEHLERLKSIAREHGFHLKHEPVIVGRHLHGKVLDHLHENVLQIAKERMANKHAYDVVFLIIGESVASVSVPPRYRTKEMIGDFYSQLYDIVKEVVRSSMPHASLLGHAPFMVTASGVVGSLPPHVRDKIEQVEKDLRRLKCEDVACLVFEDTVEVIEIPPEYRSKEALEDFYHKIVMERKTSERSHGPTTGQLDSKTN